MKTKILKLSMKFTKVKSANLKSISRNKANSSGIKETFTHPIRQNYVKLNKFTRNLNSNANNTIDEVNNEKKDKLTKIE